MKRTAWVALALSACIDFGKAEGRKDFTLRAADTAIARGASADVPLTIERTSYLSEDLVVELVTPPEGITAASVTIPATATTGTLSVAASATATAGAVTLTVRGAAREAKLVKTTSFALTIQ